jgi:hypothetical protein
MDWEVLRIAAWRTVRVPLFAILGFFLIAGGLFLTAYYLSPAWAALLMLGSVFAGVLYSAIACEYDRMITRKQQGREWK